MYFKGLNENSVIPAYLIFYNKIRTEVIEMKWITWQSKNIKEN